MDKKVFEDTKGIIEIRISKKDRQYGQKKKDKGQAMICKRLRVHIKQKIEQHEPHKIQLFSRQTYKQKI
jgi:hypothetical protein